MSLHHTAATTSETVRPEQQPRSLRHRLFLAAATLSTTALLLFSPLVQGALSETRQVALAQTRKVALSQATKVAFTQTRKTARSQNRQAVTGHHVAPSHAASTGYWHTEGARILDAQNRPVRITGVNWSGLETTNFVPGGLDQQDYHAILQTVASAGYNTVRLPFSNQAVEHPVVPANLAFSNGQGPINQDLRGLNSLQIMDKVVTAAGDLGLKIILDNHRSEAGSSAEESGLWYTSTYPESAWTADWTRLADRYRGNSTVIGVDLRNEPHNAAAAGACWDCGGATDWHLAAERAGNAVLRANPSLLVFVEGTDSYDGESYWWGGNLAGVRNSPVHLDLPNHLVYSTHVYGPREYSQNWFSESTTPATLAARWRRNWAFIAESNLAPVWIGEFGATDDALSTPEPGSEAQWFQTLVAFLGTHAEIGWSYWGANGEDRYALLDPTYQHPNPRKLAILANIARPAAPLSLPPVQEAAAHLPQQPVAELHQPRLTPASSQVDDAVAASIRQATSRALSSLNQ